MSQGKFFYMVSKLNGLVMDIRGAECNPGDEVITYHRKEDEEAANQIWFEDPITGTIRSKMNADMCLDLIDDILVVNEFEEDKDSQRWMVRGDFMISRSEENNVLTIAGADEDERATIFCRGLHGGDNQRWDFEYTGARLFYIRSKMNGKVLDVKQGDPSPGTPLIMYDKNDDLQDNQLWFENRFGAICSKLNGFSIDASGSEGEAVTLQPFDRDEIHRLWTVFGDRIVHHLNRERVLDIKSAENDNGAELCAWEWTGSDNQCWEVEYVD